MHKKQNAVSHWSLAGYDNETGTQIIFDEVVFRLVGKNGYGSEYSDFRDVPYNETFKLEDLTFIRKVAQPQNGPTASSAYTLHKNGNNYFFHGTEDRIDWLIKEITK